VNFLCLGSFVTMILLLVGKFCEFFVPRKFCYHGTFVSRKVFFLGNLVASGVLISKLLIRIGVWP
jgi:hypothetical protein